MQVIKNRNMGIVCVFFLTLVGFGATINHTLADLSADRDNVASMRLLTQEDIKGMSKWDLKLMRNAIFARHGYIFKTEKMRSHFSQQTWYRPRYDDVSDKLSEIERTNIKLLKKAEAVAPDKDTLPNMADRIAAQKRKALFAASWGSGPTELGRAGGQEAATEGPMSFAVSKKGELFILDQVNQRVQVYGATGRHLKSIAIPGRTFSDIDITANGNLMLLDIYRHKSVLVIDDDGKILKKIKPSDAGINDLSMLVGLYARKGGLWVDDGSQLICIGDVGGNKGTKNQKISGLFSQDGKHTLKAKKLGDITATVKQHSIDTSKEQRFTVYFDIPVSYLTLVDKTADGTVYLGAALFETLNAKPPYGLDQAHEVVVAFDKNGKEKHRVYMPPSFHGDGGTRWIRVGSNGKIYQLVQSNDNATMWRYDL